MNKKKIIVCILIPLILFSFNALKGKPQKKSLSEIKSDENLIFLPSYGWKHNNKSWKIEVHAWVFEPETSSIKRRMLISILRKKFKIKKGSFSNSIFEKRARDFLVDQESYKKVYVNIGTEVFYLGRTDRNGHVKRTIIINNAILKKYSKNEMIKIYTISRYNKLRIFWSHISLIKPKGISIISDIDDTIKISEVLDKKKLIENTFIKPYRAVPRMANLYKSLYNRGVQFHYLSASPWQLYPPLKEFLYDEGFPRAIWHMKYFGMSKNFSNLWMNSKKLKIPAIANIIKRFPQRNFILIGDAGEYDPEIYREIYRRFPRQILGIYIRNIRKEKEGSKRYQKLFKGCPKNIFHLFENGKDLSKKLQRHKI